jgi:IS605 OrfB family transposase
MNQKKHLEEFMNTSRYVYNKALEHIKKGHKINFMSLRDLLVTQNTKKGHIEYSNMEKEIDQLRKNKATEKEIKDKNQELRDLMKTFEYIKNPLIKDFELKTPKDIRANSIRSLCDAFTSAISNFKKGNIKSFNMKFKKKNKSYDMIELSPSSISMKDGEIKILPNTFSDNCILKISNKNKKKYKDLTIQNNVDIVKKNGNFYIHILTIPKAKEKLDIKTICGVDPGLRTLATVYSINNNETNITEYIHRKDLLKKLNNKIDKLKNEKKYYRKKQYNKIELREKNIIDSIHWNLINNLLENNDVIYFGDIKSHNIVKGNKNKTLNRSFNQMKIFVLKQRLKYKASLYQKKVIFVHEAYTTKTCSNCGTINNDVGSKEIFECSCCHLKTGRDVNASKNIMMKGLSR